MDDQQTVILTEVVMRWHVSENRRACPADDRAY